MARSDTIGGMFFENARRFGAGRVMQKERRKEGWHDYTWADVETIVREVAMGLIEAGVKEGDRVAIMCETMPQWTWLDLATASIRAVLVTVYPTNTARQLAYIVRDSGASVVVVSTAVELAKYHEEDASMPGVRTVVLIDPTVETRDDKVVTLDQLRALGRDTKHDVELERRLDATQPGDLLTLIYTSGTTGDPKGVMLSHRNLLSNVEASLEVFPIRETDVALSFLPLSHSLERMAGSYTLIRRGCTIAFAEDVSRLVQNMQEVRPTVMVAVPRIYEKMYGRILDSVESGSPLKKKLFRWAMGIGRQVSALKLAKRSIPLVLDLETRIADRLVFSKLRERLGGRLEYFISGGAPLAQEIAEFFHASDVLICEGYGLTETSPVLTCNTPDNLRFGTVGRPIPNVEIRIAEDGEILARGPNIMLGYYNKPEETAEVLEPDGWFHTGDIGEFDADGFLRITDRKKDIIVTAGGKNVAPQNIENLLKMDRYIEQACVLGDRRKFLAVLIVPAFEALREWAAESGVPFDSPAQIITRPEVRALFQKSVDHVNAQLARYESIKKFELVDSEFSVENNLLTPTMKVKRKEVLKAYRERIEAIYEGVPG